MIWSIAASCSSIHFTVVSTRVWFTSLSASDWLSLNNSVPIKFLDAILLTMSLIISSI